VDGNYVIGLARFSEAGLWSNEVLFFGFFPFAIIFWWVSVDFCRFLSISVDFCRCELRDWTREIFTGTWTGMWKWFVTGFVGFCALRSICRLRSIFVDLLWIWVLGRFRWIWVPSGLKRVLSGVVNPELQLPFEKIGPKNEKNKAMTYFNEVNSLDG
jgi:hypothetical protein